MARLNGYTGNKEEYVQTLVAVPQAVAEITRADAVPTENSSNLVKSSGVWAMGQHLQKQIDNIEVSGGSGSSFEIIDTPINDHVEPGKIYSDWQHEAAYISQYNNSLNLTYIYTDRALRFYSDIVDIKYIDDNGEAPQYCYKLE